MNVRVYSGFVVLCLILAVAAGTVHAAPDYVVGDGDILKIAVYNHPDLLTEVRVSGEEVISFPLIGEVEVGGLTVTKIADIISSRLADGFIVNPQVTIFIEEFRSKRTTIMGKVRVPGLYELHGHTTFLELLSKAGGLTPDAGDRAIIKRQSRYGIEGGVITVDLKGLVREGKTTLDIVIMDGDNVYIGEMGVVYITGEVRKPDAYRLEEGMTLMKAITRAGGFTDKAAKERVVVVRESENTEEVLEADGKGAAHDMPILPGDSVFVPKAGIFYVTGEVKKAGAYAFEVGTTVIKAITVAGGFTDKAARGRIRIIRVVEGKERIIKGVDLDNLVGPDDVIVVPESFF